MKNRLLYILLLLGLCGQEVSAAGIDGPARREIGRTLTRIVAREVAGGYVRIEGVDASRKRVRIYTSVGLSYYPFREENLRAMRDSVRLLMPPEFRKADIELYSDKREVGELIPMACRTGAEYRKLLRKKKIVPFTNRSERPLVTRSSAPVVPSQDSPGGISPCGRVTAAISTSPRTAGNGSVRSCGRPARTSIPRATCCRIWFRCSKMPGPA